MPDSSASPKETRDRICPHCFSLAVVPLGSVSADLTGIRSDYHCRDCSKDFLFLSSKRPGGLHRS
jgi:DNA-directed RNA polymerase subunit RPC12/RpoP